MPRVHAPDPRPQAHRRAIERSDEVVLDIGFEQANRAEHARGERDQDAADLEGPGHLGGEQWAVSAEGDYREVARIAAAFDCNRTHGAGNPGAANQIDTVRRLIDRKPQRPGDLLGDRLSPFLRRERKPLGSRS